MLRYGSVSVLVLIVLALLPSKTSAQVPLTVLDANGQPIAAVSIHVLGTAEIIQELYTAPDGSVIIDTPRWPDVRRLSVSHLGFRTLIIQADALPIDGMLVLEPQPVGIEGLEVQARGSICPIEPEGVARALWAEVAAGYAQDTRTRRLSGTSRQGAGSVSERYLYRVETDGLGVTEDFIDPSVYRAVDRRTRSLESFVETDGYVWDPPRVTYGRRTLAWVYPHFETVHAYHFATPEFGRVHDFRVVTERYGRVILTFCPRPGRSGLRGLLEIVPGNRFVHAEWLFETRDPDEGAGGEVVFQTYHEGRQRRPHLLAWRGIFFRHSGKTPPYPELGRDYYREVRDEIQWRPLPPGSAGGRR